MEKFPACEILKKFQSPTVTYQDTLVMSANFILKYQNSLQLAIKTTYNPICPNSSCNCVISSEIPSASLDEVEPVT